MELEAVYDRLTGAARLDSMDHWLSLVIEGFPSGEVRVNGQVRDSIGTDHQNVLSFAISGLDQTYLPALIAQLEAIENQFMIPGQLLLKNGF